MSRRKREKDADCDAINAQFGKTIGRLRRAGALSLGELAEQSGVAKSMISQIEKNESNPTLATITRLSRALGTSVETVLSMPDTIDGVLVEHALRKDTPVLMSDDGLCTLRIIGSMDTIEFVQWYDFTAKPGGKLESSAHPDGSVENLSVLSGTLRVTIGEEHWTVGAGETLRYRADREHVIENIGGDGAHATMVNILAFAAG